MDASASRVLSFARVVMLSVVLLVPVSALPTTNAAANGDWISIGVPTSMYVGSAGHFYLTGNDMGSCAGTTPYYFRVDMNATHWKELYTLILYAHAQQRALSCTVDSGCGSTQVWVSYCNAAL